MLDLHKKRKISSTSTTPFYSAIIPPIVYTPSQFPSYNMGRDTIPWSSYIIGWEVWMLNSSTGLWVGLLGIVLGVLGFFYAPLWLGAGAVLLGLVALAYSYKSFVGWISLILGVVVLIWTLMS